MKVTEIIAVADLMQTATDGTPVTLKVNESPVGTFYFDNKGESDYGGYFWWQVVDVEQTFNGIEAEIVECE